MLSGGVQWALATAHHTQRIHRTQQTDSPYTIPYYCISSYSNLFFFCFLFYLLIWLYYLSKIQHTPGIVQALCTTTIYHRIYHTCHVIRFCRRSVFSCFFFRNRNSQYVHRHIPYILYIILYIYYYNLNYINNFINWTLWRVLRTAANAKITLL